jgi:tRNA(fMet)-specific endonuclease VapC
MSYLIDSDRVADWLAGRTEAVQLIATLRREGVALSVISYVEVLEGIINAVDPRRGRRAWQTFLRGTRVLVVSRPIAERTAAIRVDLRQQKRQVNERALDILIAATAIEHKLILVTRNTRDYEDIPGQRLYQEPKVLR